MISQPTQGEGGGVILKNYIPDRINSIVFRNSCLHWAASFGSPDTISLLLARGAQVNHLQGIRDGNL